MGLLAVSAQQVVAIGIIAAVAKAISSIVVSFFECRLSGQIAASQRERACAALLMSGQAPGGGNPGALLAVRLRELERAVSAGALTGARAVAQLVPLVATLIFVSLRLAILAALVLLPFTLLLARGRRPFRAAPEAALKDAEQLHASVDELVRQLDLFRSYGRGRALLEHLGASGRRAILRLSKVEALRSGLSAGNEVLGALALLGMLLAAPRLGVGTHDGTLIAFAAVFFLAYRPLRDLGDARAWSQRGASALAGVQRLIESAPSSGAVATAAREVHGLDRLEVDRFGARWHAGRTSFTVEPGELVCLYGPTGSGKSTLLRALLGLEPAEGTLRYGGRDLSAAPVGPASRPFAWVPQEAGLVAGSVLDNVALFSSGPGALQALDGIGAGALSALADERVGPFARALSGGERRQVAIARAVSTELPVLLLDEPTEGLDADAQQAVLSALGRLKGKRSMLVVSHRPEVCALADRTVAVGASPSLDPPARSALRPE